jgi:predicted MFS family arabinose efflux permease
VIQSAAETRLGLQSLWSKELLFLFGATFIAYANISVFFYFYDYLRSLPIHPGSYGFLMAVFSAVSLAVRPFISPFFHSGNAKRYSLLGAGMVIAALFAYSLVIGFWSLTFIRCFHGFAFVVLGTALVSVLIDHIPEARSAQVFGLLAIVILIPNTVVPPLLPFLSRAAGGFTGVLILFACITTLVFPLLAGLRPREGRISVGQHRLTLQEVREDLRHMPILFSLMAMLFLYSGHALVFFFLDGYGRSIGIADTGFFLTLSSLGEIGCRVVAGSRFDRAPKASLLTWTMVGLALGYGALAHVPGRIAFFGLGLALGIGWGIAMPVFNSLMFDISQPRFRAFNINLGFQMFQAGFFLGPFVGGPVVARAGFRSLYYAAAGLSLLSALLTSPMKGRLIR